MARRALKLRMRPDASFRRSRFHSVSRISFGLLWINLESSSAAMSALYSRWAKTARFLWLVRVLSGWITTIGERDLRAPRHRALLQNVAVSLIMGIAVIWLKQGKTL